MTTGLGEVFATRGEEAARDLLRLLMDVGVTPNDLGQVAPLLGSLLEHRWMAGYVAGLMAGLGSDGAA